MRYLLAAFGLFALSACAIQPVYRTLDTPLATRPIELDRYAGLWHEQARLPNWFERGCTRATAEYGVRPDGLISVRNTCFRENGRDEVANGRARVVGEGQLKVSFFGPFWGDYWVLERADDYSWSIVGEPGGRYLWLLTRAERLSPQERAAFEQRIARLGYEPGDLYWAP
ncbi:MAG: lipocalin family protein [Hyphomonadaceae bacterium]|nr:lipocalin family protein [Hyphomonadaceae bacterium]